MYNIREAMNVSNFLKPTMYAKDIFHISYNKLKEMGIQYLLFDIDNTIAQTNVKTVSGEVEDLFKNLKKEGFGVVLLTNALPRRAKRFGAHLGIDVFCLSWKPARFHYKKIIKKYNLMHEEIAAIGDQIYTDIKGANKMGILSVLVDPLSKRESVFTKLNRVKEDRLIKKKKVITRGEYYE